MRIPELREKISTADGRGVRVGILDTGIDAEHPDLKGKTLLFKDFVNGKMTPYDDHGHGTHVAGTIAGSATSGTSIGVAPAATLIVGKIFSASGSASEDQIMEAMQWIVDPDGNPATADAPMLVSNSWGGGSASGDPADSAECRAVESWLKLSVLPVFAAGNEGPSARTVGLPAACPSALAVGATDENDKIASFSSRGPAVWSTGSFMKPLVSAPGVRVLSAAPRGKYVSMSGTSMATPHVAGVAALVYQARPNSRTEDIAKLMMAGAIDLGPAGQDPAYGYGRVDVIKTMEISFGIRH
jgi:subtilisin family serine protease